MLKNLFTFQGKKQLKDGIVQVKDNMIWTFGHNLKSSEIDFIAHKYKIPVDVLENISLQKCSLISKNPIIFCVPDVVFEKNKFMANNIFIVIGADYVLTLMPHNISEYAPNIDSELDAYSIIYDLFLKKIQRTYDALDWIDDQIKALGPKDFEQAKHIRKDLSLLEGQLEQISYLLETKMPFKTNKLRKDFFADADVEIMEQMDVIEQYHKLLDKYEPRKQYENFDYGLFFIDLILLALMGAFVYVVFFAQGIFTQYFSLVIPESFMIKIIISLIGIAILCLPMLFLHLIKEK